MWTRVPAVLFLVTLALAAPAGAGSPISGFQETVFQGGLSGPTAIAFLPDGHMLITEQSGALKLSDGTSVSTLINIPVCSAVEMGLLGVAVDPDFASNGFVYLYRTKNPGSCASPTGRVNEVVRITIGPGDTVDPTTLTVLLTGALTGDGENHNGGCLRIGPDGKLYVGVGDTGTGDNQGGPGSSTNPYSQNLSVLMGKVLRINLDPNDLIPADNPFVGQSGKRPEIFAYGFRNPFRFSFDPLTGKLWVADVGDLTVEEIDIVTSGGNYGWPNCEGTLPSGCELPGDIDPIFTYLHSGSSSLGECIIGGGFAPSGFGGFDNDYFFGDCVSSNIYSAAPTGAQRDGVSTPASFLTGGNTPSDIIFGPDGALYYVAESGGEVRRVAPILPPDQPVFGSKLTLKDNATNPAKKSLTMLSMDGIVLGDDPTIAGGPLGGSLEVVSESPGAAFDECYPLPAANWSIIGKLTDHKGFTYKDGKLLAGPVKSAQVNANKLVKASGKGSALGFSLGATSPGPVTVILSLGTRRYCATFGGTTKFTASKSFSAKAAPTPASCPPSNCP
jgi:glucose/arabinose dehydrogenase